MRLNRITHLFRVYPLYQMNCNKMKRVCVCEFTDNADYDASNMNAFIVGEKEVGL